MIHKYLEKLLNNWQKMDWSKSTFLGHGGFGFPQIHGPAKPCEKRSQQHEIVSLGEAKLHFDPFPDLCDLRASQVKSGCNQAFSTESVCNIHQTLTKLSIFIISKNASNPVLNGRIANTNRCARLENPRLFRYFDVSTFQTNRWISSSGDYILLPANVSPTYSSGLLQGNVFNHKTCSIPITRNNQ